MAGNRETLGCKEMEVDIVEISPPTKGAQLQRGEINPASTRWSIQLEWTNNKEDKMGTVVTAPVLLRQIQ